MILYVMRHGHSPTCVEAGCATDAERPLSEKGRADARAQARRLLESGARPKAVLHSPLRRAAETAAEAAAVLGVPAKPLPSLANQVGPEELAAALAGPLAEAGELLAVGHQPQVGELCAYLADRVFDFKPAGIVALQADEPALPPRGARPLRVLP